jgi:magnesium-transporting ATPase (P-type)
VGKSLISINDLSDSLMKNESEPQEAISWHALPLQEVRELLSTAPEGLSEGDARARLARYGANRLQEEKSAAWPFSFGSSGAYSFMS